MGTSPNAATSGAAPLSSGRPAERPPPPAPQRGPGGLGRRPPRVGPVTPAPLRPERRRRRTAGDPAFRTSSSDSLCGTEKQLVTSTECLSTVPAGGQRG